MTESAQRDADDPDLPSTHAIDASPQPNRMSDAEFDQCYRQFASGLRITLKMRLKNDLDVEDCLNRVFEKLWLQGHEIAPVARRSWLFVVARNEAALVGRNLARRSIERAGNDELSEAADSDSQTETRLPLEVLLRNEQVERLRLASRELTDQQKEILSFRFYDDLTFREIADRLQIPIGTALTRARAAILKLRNLLDDEKS